MKVVKASRPDHFRLPVALIGAAGSGKTYSALLMARGIAGPDGKIVSIDTEGERSKIYYNDEQIGGYYAVDFEAPYTPDRGIEAIDSAIKAGAACIVFDSGTDTSRGEGGLLEMAEAEEKKMLDRNPRDQSAAMRKWIKPKAAYERFMNKIFRCPVPIIITIREEKKLITKPKLDSHGQPIMRNGRPQTITEEGFLPLYEKNFPYKMGVVLRMRPDHRIEIVRSQKPLEPIFKPGEIIDERMGAALARFLKDGAPAQAKKQEAEAPAQEAAPAAPKQEAPVYPDPVYMADCIKQNGHKYPAFADGAPEKAALCILRQDALDGGGEGLKMAWKQISKPVQKLLQTMENQDYLDEIRNIADGKQNA